MFDSITSARSFDLLKWDFLNEKLYDVLPGNSMKKAKTSRQIILMRLFFLFGRYEVEFFAEQSFQTRILFTHSDFVLNVSLFIFFVPFVHLFQSQLQPQ